MYEYKEVGSFTIETKDALDMQKTAVASEPENTTALIAKKEPGIKTEILCEPTLYMQHSALIKKDNDLFLHSAFAIGKVFVCETYDPKNFSDGKAGDEFAKKILYCNQCSYKAHYPSLLEQHIRIHTGEKPYKCKHCDYRSVRKGTLNTHLKTHTGEKPYSCTYCDYRSACKRTLACHIRIHTAEKPFACTLCEYRGTTKKILKIHERTHTGERPYKCTFCEYRCSTKSSLLYHVRIHSERKPFSCTLCNYKCRHKFHLTRHLRMHAGDKHVCCELCDFKTDRKITLENHIKRVHENLCTEEEKAFNCRSCSYKTNDRSNFLRHSKKHSGEKPHSCSTCDYRTYRKSNLNNHIRKIHPHVTFVSINENNVVIKAENRKPLQIDVT